MKRITLSDFVMKCVTLLISSAVYFTSVYILMSLGNEHRPMAWRILVFTVALTFFTIMSDTIVSFGSQKRRKEDKGN